MKKYRTDFRIAYCLTTIFSVMLAAIPSSIVLIIFELVWKNSSGLKQDILFVLLAFILPILLTLVAVLDLVKIHRFLQPYPKVTLNSKTRLYEPPQNLPPLVLARYIYHADFAELGTTNFVHDELDMSQAMQATVLDLIDRGNLQLDVQNQQKVLVATHYEGLAEFELEFINLLFDKEISLPLDKVYKAFQIDQTSFDDLDKVTVDEIKRYRRLLLGRFVSQKLRIRDLVEKEIKNLGLPSLYHDLTSKQEQAKLTTLKMIPFISIGSLWVLPLLSLNDLHIWLWFYPILAAILTYYYTKIDLATDNRIAILTPEGLEAKHLWSSFRRMLLEIGDFKKKSTQNIILWNRYIVYAVFFGIVQAADTELGTFDLALSRQMDEEILESLQKDSPKTEQG